jgi:hypothetical protein
MFAALSLRKMTPNLARLAQQIEKGLLRAE